MNTDRSRVSGGDSEETPEGFEILEEGLKPITFAIIQQFELVEGSDEIELDFWVAVATQDISM